MAEFLNTANMKIFVLLTIFVTVCTSLSPHDWKIINHIKSDKLTWKAGPNHITANGVDYMKRLLGATMLMDRTNSTRYYPPTTYKEIPETFDAREHWPNCQSIRSIKDQSNCGSCWAVTGASTMSDRLCIASAGRIQVNISAEYLMSCCSECGKGCETGDVGVAWRWFLTHGIVTGGDYGSNEGCEPYQIEPCSSDLSYHEPPCKTKSSATPKCVDHVCYNKNYTVPFEQDKHFAKSTYLLPKNATMIQREILDNGPVATVFDIYDDFFHYKSGVYQHVYGNKAGAHAGRILGWGTENGTPYWLVANSWNNKWGDHGTYKFLRGSNECGFEHYVVGGIPLV